MLLNSLLFIVLLSALAFGSVQPWAYGFCSSAVGLLFMAWAIKKYSVYTTQKIQQLLLAIRPVTDLIIVFLFVLGFLAIGLIMPFSAAEELPHLWIAGKKLLETEMSVFKTFPANSSTTSDIFLIVSYGLTFLISFYHCQAKAKARLVFTGLMYAGFIYSFYGLIVYLGEYGIVLWLKNKTFLSAVHGTFINPSHFAIFSGLTLLCTLALLTEEINKTIDEYQHARYMGWPSSLNNISLKPKLLSIGLVVLILALSLSFSRCVIFATLFAGFVFLLALNLRIRLRDYYAVWLIDTAWLAAIFLIFGMGLFCLTDTQTTASTIATEIRSKTFALGWAAIMDKPWTGYGLNSFTSIFSFYNLHLLPNDPFYVTLPSASRNSYLELVFQLGIPASLGLFYCFAKIAWLCFKGLCIRKQQWIYPAAGLAATLLIVVSAFFEANLQIPAIAYSYALLVGTACAQSLSTRSDNQKEGRKLFKSDIKTERFFHKIKTKEE